MVGQRRLDFGLFQDLGGRMTLYSPEPLQLRERDDGGRFTTEVNDLVQFPRAVIICRLCAHHSTTISTALGTYQAAVRRVRSS
jgi:hypothetical protein